MDSFPKHRERGGPVQRRAPWGGIAGVALASVLTAGGVWSSCAERPDMHQRDKVSNQPAPERLNSAEVARLMDDTSGYVVEQASRMLSDEVHEAVKWYGGANSYQDGLRVRNPAIDGSYASGEIDVATGDSGVLRVLMRYYADSGDEVALSSLTTSFEIDDMGVVSKLASGEIKFKDLIDMVDGDRISPSSIEAVNANSSELGWNRAAVERGVDTVLIVAEKSDSLSSNSREELFVGEPGSEDLFNEASARVEEARNVLRERTGR